MNKDLRLKIVGIALLFVIVLLLGDSYRTTPIGMAIAQGRNLDFALNNLNGLQKEYNANIDKVPKFIKTLFGDEKINVTITRSNGTIAQLSVETENGIIKEISTESFEEYTLNIWVAEEIINEIINAEEQTARLKQALDDKEITYKALRFTTAFKLAVSKIFLALFG